MKNNARALKTTSVNAPHSTIRARLITYTVIMVIASLWASQKVWAPIEGFGTEPMMLLTENEHELLAKVLMSEARGEPFEGVLAVCQVVVDRLRNGSWGDSISEVLSKEFAEPYEGEVSEKILKAIKAVCYEGIRVTEESLLYFINRDMASHKGRIWQDQNTALVLKIGSHEFRR